MKKLLSLMLLSAMLLTLLAACKPAGGNEGSTTADPGEQPPEVIYTDPSTETLRVMSFNIQEDLEKGNVTGIDRVNAVKQEILDNNPDVIGVQEDTSEWHYLLELEGYSPIYPSNNECEENCVIFVRDTLEVVESGYRYLSPNNTPVCALTPQDLYESDSPYKLSSSDLKFLKITEDTTVEDLMAKRKINNINNSLVGVRRMTYVVLNLNGQLVIYVNTHFQNRAQFSEFNNYADSTAAANFDSPVQRIRSMERKKSVAIIQDTIAMITETYTNAKVVITGDMNDFSEAVDGSGKTWMYQAFTEWYSDTRVLAKEKGENHISGPQSSWNPYLGSAYQEIPAEDRVYPLEIVDFCFVSKEGVSVEHFTTGNGYAKFTTAQGEEKTAYTSDHLPIIIELSFQAPGEPVEEETANADMWNGGCDVFWYNKDDPDNEYTLNTAEEFWGFLRLRKDGETFEDITVKIGKDMVFSPLPVADRISTKKMYLQTAPKISSAFLGTFDGQGHTLTGLQLTYDFPYNTDGTTYGLLGNLGKNAVVKDITLAEAAMYSAGGAIAGQIAQGANVTISGVKLQLSTGTSTVRVNDIGGIVGKVNSGATLVLDQCQVKVALSTRGYNIGGLIAQAESDSSVTVQNCRVEGNLQAVDYVGGIIGKCSTTPTLQNNTVSVEITSDGKHGQEIGGN